MKLKIKKGSTVEVIAGAEKGKRGSVLEISKTEKRIRIKVQGIRIQTHFDKKEGLQKREGFFDYSNVKLIEQAPAKKSASKKTKKTSAKAAASDE